MTTKKILRLTIWAILIIVLYYFLIYAWRSFPLISGFGAKNLCSCVFLTGMDQQKVEKEELSGFPLSLGRYKVNYSDSSVTGSVAGFAKRKAIFLNGLGCILVNEFLESDIRKRQVFLPYQAGINTDTILWPIGDLLPDTLDSKYSNLQQVVSNFFIEKDTNHPVYTRAILVIHKGRLVTEKYAPGFNRHTKMQGWSMAKSLTGALIGILVKDGKLSVHQTAPVTEWKNEKDLRSQITLKHLLQQTSGLKFSENYKRYSDVTNMLFNKGDMAAYTANLKLQYVPGTVFNYSSGNSNVLSRIVRKTLGDSNYYRFPAESLFYKINMYNTILEPDASGTIVGSSYIFATARDYARFGLLYLNDGVWNGKRILPDGWVKQTVTAVSADTLMRYGYQFWLNGFDKNDKTKRWYPDVPDDMFFADGYGGQNIYIIPSKDLVVVRLGVKVIDENLLLKKIVETIE